MGMSIYGKMSTGMVTTADPPRMAIRIAITTNVYGRLNASRTIHISVTPRSAHAARGNPCRYVQYTSRCWAFRVISLPSREPLHAVAALIDARSDNKHRGSPTSQSEPRQHGAVLLI